MFGRETLTLDEVIVALNSKELKNKSDERSDAGDGLYVRGRSEQR